MAMEFENNGNNIRDKLNQIKSVQIGLFLELPKANSFFKLPFAIPHILIAGRSLRACF